MVALLVGLKLTLLRNSLRRSVWRTVGMAVGAAYGLAVVVAALAGMVALRRASIGFTADLTVLAFSVLTVGWLLMSLLVFGVDETVDPAKFALLPVRARELLPGMLLGGLIGVPGVATALVATGLVITWSRSLPAGLAAVVAVPLGVATCFLLSRTATAAFAAFLGSRRFRDLALVALALFGAVFGIAVNLLSSYAQRNIGEFRAGFERLATVVSWTPFGWVWAFPADVARGNWSAGAVHLTLSVSLVALLWVAWGHFLGARLVSPLDRGGQGARVRESSWVDRLYPATPAGAVAVRTLHYWRRDPRYLAGVAGFLIAPIVIMVTQLANPQGSPQLVMLAPAMIGLLVGVSVAQDLCYDGTALWLHVATGLRGAEDRAGRIMSTLTVYLPLMCLLLGVAVAVTGEWRLLTTAAGITLGMMLTGLGVGSVVGSLWQWPAPPPGANPFQKGNAGGLPALLCVSVTTFGTLLASLPIIAMVVWSYFSHWVTYLTLPVGLVCGFVALRVGISQGGRILDRRWPEVLVAVSERTA